MTTLPLLFSPRRRGQLAILLSAFFFYGATVIIERSRSVEAIPASVFVAGRFGLGLIYVGIVFASIRRLPAVKHPASLLTRALSNCAAVWCFYQATTMGGPAVANSLNMTYPVFLAVWALVIGAHGGRRGFVASLVAFGGVVAILRPGDGIAAGGLIGLLSGAMAAVSVASLEATRQHHDTTTVLLFVHLLGSVIMLSIAGDALFALSPHGWLLVLLSGAIGVVGQILFTYGAKFVSPVENGVLSSLRIVIAMMCAPIFEYGRSIGFIDLVGALLLFAANVLVITARRRAQEVREEPSPG